MKEESSTEQKWLERNRCHKEVSNIQAKIPSSICRGSMLYGIDIDDQESLVVYLSF